MRRALLLAAALAATSSAQAQTPSATPPDGHAGEVLVKARKPIVVTAATCPEPDPSRYRSDRAPQVVDSYPAAGVVTPPGYVRVRVSFDQPMSCFSEVMVDGGEGDPCEPDGTWVLPDRKSWLMSCRFTPATDVRIRLAPIDGRGFVGLSGRQAAPYVLAFTTSDGPASETLAASAGMDPGPPGERRATTALVTCADARHIGEQAKDCQRTAYAAPR